MADLTVADIDGQLVVDLSSRYKEEDGCFAYIVDTYSTQIAQTFAMASTEEHAVAIRVDCLDEDRSVLNFSLISFDYLQKLYDDMYGEAGNRLVSVNVELAKLRQHLVIYCEWNYYPECWSGYTYEESLEKMFLKAHRKIGFAPRPFVWATEPEQTVRKSSPKKEVVSEKTLERNLLEWLHSRGIQSDLQISTAKHRMDIWIPGKCFLELKKGKVSGDDVCQAMDYCCEYKRTVVLVGNHISEMASRGIEAYNKSLNSEMLAFVSWSAVKTYLKGLLENK